MIRCRAGRVAMVPEADALRGANGPRLPQRMVQNPLFPNIP